MQKKSYLISIFIPVAVIAFILCGGCGFNSYPTQNTIITHRANTLDRKITVIQCDSTQFCKILKSTIDSKTTSTTIQSDDLVIHNAYYATIVATIKTLQITPVISFDSGPSPFYKYTYQADFYFNSYDVSDKKISIQDYLVTTPTEQLRQEAKSYHYKNTYLYTTESQVWNHLYQQAAEKLITQLIESNNITK